jgi:histidinol-phosphatase (PHP family)
MSLANYHTHSFFCDGEGELEDYVLEALEKGFDALGFSSHAPIPNFKSYVMDESRLPAYCEQIRNLKVKYRDKIQIYLGLEIDYIPAVVGPGSAQFACLGLDYTIGSIHFIKDPRDGQYWELDESAAGFAKITEEIFKGRMEDFISYYYLILRQMLRLHNPDIIGHLDLVQKFNSHNEFFSENEKWYQDEVRQTLQVIAAAGSILEINTGGIARGYVKSPYPSAWIIAEARKLGIPIILSSDAHTPKALDAAFEQAKELLRGAGYFFQRRIYNGIWQDTLL